MRKLASIRKISEIRPITGADQIVCAVVDGWELVTQKSNNFQPGDLVVYFEIDSVLPEREEFEFLRDRCWVSAERSVNGAGFRLKTIRLRGQISQGLIIPWREFYKDLMGYNDIYEGMDLTEILGVVKYERPLPSQLNGVAKGNFPTFIRKTDQDRVQNVFNKMMRNHGKDKWEVSLKLDGTSFTAYFDKCNNHFGVCSRNYELEDSENDVYWRVAKELRLEEKLRDLGKSIAIQGELMGPGIQGNRESLSKPTLYVFDIFDILNYRYYPSEERINLTKYLGIDHVPVIDWIIFNEITTTRDILDMADGPSINHKIREGLVFKNINNPGISFKAISNKFLLKGGDD